MSTLNMTEESITYYFTPDDTPINEDDWTEQQGESGDYWEYKFTGEELSLLDYYLGRATKEEIQYLLRILQSGGTPEYSYHHALHCVLAEFT